MLAGMLLLRALLRRGSLRPLRPRRERDERRARRGVGREGFGEGRNRRGKAGPNRMVRVRVLFRMRHHGSPGVLGGRLIHPVTLNPLQFPAIRNMRTLAKVDVEGSNPFSRSTKR
jgi:hypothetical protein